MKDDKMAKEMPKKAKAASGTNEPTAMTKAYDVEPEASQGELTGDDLDKVAGGSWQRPSIRRWFDFNK